MPQLTGKTALVTGAAGGIGAAVARLFAAEGAAVALLDLPHTAGPAIAAEIQHNGYQALFVPTNIAAETEVAQAVGTTLQAFNRLDILVNVAGINRKGRVQEFSVEDWDLMMAVNVRGMFLTVKHALPAMRAGGSGAIVNLSSVSAFIGSDGYAAYHTTKGAVLSLTNALALELAPHNIRVNALCPGWVDTPFSDTAIDLSGQPAVTRTAADASHVLGRMARPKEVAQAALFLASDAASFITGTPLLVDGGFMIKK